MPYCSDSTETFSAMMAVFWNVLSSEHHYAPPVTFFLRFTIHPGLLHECGIKGFSFVSLCFHFLEFLSHAFFLKKPLFIMHLYFIISEIHLYKK